MKNNPILQRVKNNNYTLKHISQAEIDKAIAKWNWGAFFCTWLWGVFHKTYWPLLIVLVGCIPYVGLVASLCLAVYLGMNGSKIAWDKEVYKDFDSFKRAQRSWTIGGCVWFGVSLLATAYMVFFTLSML